MIKLEPDERAMANFHRTVRELQKVSGKDFQTTMRAELGAVLNGTIRRTKKATPATIEKNIRNQKAVLLNRPYTGPSNKSGGRYIFRSAEENARLHQAAAKRAGKSKFGGAKILYYMPTSQHVRRYPDSVWAEIQSKQDKKFASRVESRGLAARMFVEIAKRLRIPVKAAAYIRKAKGGDNMHSMVKTYESGTGRKYSVGFVNSLTHANVGAKAGYAFRLSLNARATYWKKAMQLAAKGKIKKALDRYPGLGKVS